MIEMKKIILRGTLSNNFARFDTYVKNMSLKNANSAIENILLGIENAIYTDLLAQEIRQANYYIGEITWQVTNDEILGNIFSKFCIGK